MPTAGDTIGRYRLHRRLGAGGAGQVWEAELCGPHGFRKMVALKLLDRAGPHSRAGLIREARLSAILHHPNIVDVYELGAQGALLFVAMERVPGPDVNRLLKVFRPLPPRAAVQIALQVARALVCAHGNVPAVVHRDLKPSNLLVDPSGIVKVADFGIARVAGASAGIEGTPGYMSPEQLHGGEVSTPTDVFSLGVAMVQLVLGRRPLTAAEGRQLETAAGRLQERVPVVVQQLDEGFPGLGELVEACLAADPAHRPLATELVERLETLERFAPGASLIELLTAQLEGSSGSELVTVAHTPRAGNVPPEPNTFVGRQPDLQALESAFAEARLVTLKGMGGLGKTRLAMRWAKQQPRGGGAWFCDLADATTLPGVLHAIAGPLGVPLNRGGASDLARRLGQALRGRGDVLLLLDNAEQVVEATAQVVEVLLREAPDATLLVTSREPLMLAGERVVDLAPLGAAEGRALLLARAAGWRPRPQDEGPLEQLVARLDGVPLALELAAARLPMVGPARILERLDRTVLSDRRRDRPARQATLEAVVDWSWELLDAHERAALVALAAFRGGFALEAAEAVLEGGPDAPFALDLLTSLVDRSMVHVRTLDGEPRFGMFEMVRAFAVGRLGPAATAQACARHAAWFDALVNPSTIAAASSLSGHRLHRGLRREVDNLLAASDWAFGAGDDGLALRTFRAAWWLLADRGPYAPLAERGDALLQRPRVDPAQRSMLLQIVATIRWRLGEPERAVELCTESLALAQDLGGVALAGALRMRGTMLHAAGRTDEALEHFEDAIGRAQRLGATDIEVNARWGRGICLRSRGRRPEALVDFASARALAARVGRVGMLCRAATNHGMALADAGRFAEAEEAFTEGLEYARRIGSAQSQAMALGSLATIHAEQGRLDEGIGLLGRARQLHRRLGQRSGEALDLVNLAEMQRMAGRLDEAEVSLTEGIALARELGARGWLALASVVKAMWHRDRGEPAEAIEAATHAVALYREIEDAWGVGVARAALGESRLAAGELDAAQAELDAALASHGATGDRLHTGLTRCMRSELALARGAPDLAVAELQHARDIAEALEVLPTSELAQRIRRVAGRVPGGQ